MPLLAKGLERFGSVCGSPFQERVGDKREEGQGWAVFITAQVMKRRIRSIRKKKHLLNQM